MKIVKFILLVLFCIIVLLLIVAAFAKKEMMVEKEIIINKPKADVFAYIKLLRNQENYGKWNLMDVNMKKTYTGTDGTLGFIAAWDSNNKDVGKGEQEIKQITEGERIDFELRFKKPFESTAQVYITTEAIAPTQTKVKWGFNGKMNYPLNIMLVFMSADDMMGKDFSIGLKNLKNILENKLY